MDKTKQSRLESKGWKVGTAEDFLNMNELTARDVNKSGKRAELVTTTELSKMFGLQVPTKLLIELGVDPEFKTDLGYYWAKSDISDIGMALIMHISNRNFEIMQEYRNGKL